MGIYVCRNLAWISLAWYVLALKPFLHTFSGDRIIVENNERIRFVLKNGLEIPEQIERAMR